MINKKKTRREASLFCYYIKKAIFDNFVTNPRTNLNPSKKANRFSDCFPISLSYFFFL